MPFLNTGDVSTTIYEYNRGDKTVRVDPAVVWRKMNIACRKMGTSFEKMMDQWNESIAKKSDLPDEVERKFLLYLDIEPKIERIAREAFDIPEVNEEGHGGTVALVIMTLNDFLSEREKKSESTEISPYSLPPTDGGHPDSSKESLVSSD